MNYHLDDLNIEEAKAYIQGKVSHAKGYGIIFSENALESIINVAGGVLRIINKICDKCLLIGHNKEANEINNDIVMRTVNETEIG